MSATSLNTPEAAAIAAPVQGNLAGLSENYIARLGGLSPEAVCAERMFGAYVRKEDSETGGGSVCFRNKYRGSVEVEFESGDHAEAFFDGLFEASSGFVGGEPPAVEVCVDEVCADVEINGVSMIGYFLGSRHLAEAWAKGAALALNVEPKGLEV